MRYSKYRADDREEYPPPTNPIWRGIGCILLLLTPIVSLLISNEVMKTGLVQQYIDIPAPLRNTFVLPAVDVTFEMFNATLVLTAGVTVGLFALFFVLYAVVYKVLGPSPYGPTDVPPNQVKRRAEKSR